MPVRKFDISTSTIFRFLLIILGIIFLYLIRDILLLVFFAIIVAAAIEGPVKWMQQKGIRRVFGVIIMYAFALALLGATFYLIIPPLVSESKMLIANLPEISQKLGLSFETLQQRFQAFEISGLFSNLGQRLEGAASSIFQTTFGFLGGLVSFFLVFVISFYLAVQEGGIKKFLASFTPKEHKDYVVDLARRIEEKLGAWLRGQLILMLIVGTSVFIGLSLLGIKYALVLALLAALLEVVPYIGPMIAAIPAIVIAFFQTPLLALAVALLYYVIQQIENYVFVPQIMKKAVGLNPVVIILVMLVGAKLAGVLGIIIAVPLAATVRVFWGDMFKEPE